MDKKGDGSLQDVLGSVVGKLDVDPVKADAICRILVDTTLAVRDELVARGDHLTVAETRQAVELLLQQLGGEPMPYNLPSSIKMLLDEWIKALKETS